MQSDHWALRNDNPFCAKGSGFKPVPIIPTEHLHVAWGENKYNRIFSQGRRVLTTQKYTAYSGYIVHSKNIQVLFCLHEEDKSKKVD